MGICLVLSAASRRCERAAVQAATSASAPASCCAGVVSCNSLSCCTAPTDQTDQIDHDLDQTDQIDQIDQTDQTDHDLDQTDHIDDDLDRLAPHLPLCEKLCRICIVQIPKSTKNYHHKLSQLVRQITFFNCTYDVTGNMCETKQTIPPTPGNMR